MSTPEGDGFATAQQTAVSTLPVPLNAGTVQEFRIFILNR